MGVDGDNTRADDTDAIAIFGEEGDGDEIDDQGCANIRSIRQPDRSEPIRSEPEQIRSFFG